ncbi:MAG: guanylate kinase [Candidatus Calescibacterium sp.]|jgi:guanylate kinase
MTEIKEKIRGKKEEEKNSKENNNKKIINLIVISGPSGVGKTTIIKKILQDPELKDKLMFSVSHTTRKKREGEVEGQDYFFVSEEEFMRMVERGEFIEWAKVHGHLYGTSYENIKLAQKSGKLLILDIDVQGAEKVREKKGDSAIFIFIKPPNLDELKKRLELRGDTKDIETRINNAKKELEFEKKFDYSIVNENLEKAVLQVKEIIKKFINNNK